jgi:hypothetical protein
VKDANFLERRLAELRRIGLFGSSPRRCSEVERLSLSSKVSPTSLPPRRLATWWEGKERAKAEGIDTRGESFVKRLVLAWERGIQKRPPELQNPSILSLNFTLRLAGVHLFFLLG